MQSPWRLAVLDKYRPHLVPRVAADHWRFGRTDHDRSRIPEIRMPPTQAETSRGIGESVQIVVSVTGGLDNDDSPRVVS